MKNKIVEYRCDICGKDMRRSMPYTDIRDYKVKIKGRNIKTRMFKEPITLNIWKKLDVCEECMQKFKDFVERERCDDGI